MIVLLTDFGPSEYAGILKGIIHEIDYETKIIDLCHSISPQSIIEASWILKNNYPYFPRGAVFCCVVDPGVGSKRKAIAVKTKNYFFVAPDNGLLHETLKEQQIIEIRKIPVPKTASKTFHARDVFAKAAATINRGEFESIGKQTTSIKKLSLHKKAREGIIVRIDHFGNLITNLPKLNKKSYTVKINNKTLKLPFYSTYEQAKSGLFLIEGSCNTLEISKKNANANQELNLKANQKITIQ